MNYRSFLCLFLVGALFFGCSSVPAPKFYRVSLDLSAINSAPLGPLRQSIRVAPFRAVSPFRQDSIVTYCEDSPLIRFSGDCLWESSPPDMVRQKLAEAFRASGLFTRVESQPGRPHADYIIRGQILRFNELETSEGSYGEVGLAVQFLSHEKHEILWSTIVSVREKAQTDSSESVALAVSEALHQCIVYIIQHVNHATASRRPTH
jgi:ABC-type uncharacterized transport system auxiliary subunit